VSALDPYLREMLVQDYQRGASIASLCERYVVTESSLRKFLRDVPQGPVREAEAMRTQNEDILLLEQVRELLGIELSIAEIARRLNISESKVRRLRDKILNIR